MEMMVIIFIPLLLLLLMSSFLVVAQVSGFMQSTFFNSRQNFSNMIIQRYMERIALAQTQLFRRSRQLEALSTKLSLSNQELFQLNNMKTKFLSMVVHDIRTPLASIKGFSELLMKKKTEPKEKIYLEHIVSATTQLNRLISDLTDLAMIEAGKLKMDREIHDFSETARDILPGISIKAREKGVILEADEMPEGILVKGDKFRLSQVMMNLLNNAVKFTPAGKKVELAFHVSGKYVTTTVKDAGIGLHPNDAKRVFEKFYQAKHQKDERLRKQGWGLGLAISQEIVQAHKGEIGATSAGLGKGSTFWFKVPLG